MDNHSETASNPFLVPMLTALQVCCARGKLCTSNPHPDTQPTAAPHSSNKPGSQCYLMPSYLKNPISRYVSLLHLSAEVEFSSSPTCIHTQVHPFSFSPTLKFFPFILQALPNSS